MPRIPLDPLSVHVGGRRRAAPQPAQQASIATL